MASVGSFIVRHNQGGGTIQIQTWVDEPPSHRVQAKWRGKRGRVRRQNEITHGNLYQRTERDAALRGELLCMLEERFGKGDRGPHDAIIASLCNCIKA